MAFPEKPPPSQPPQMSKLLGGALVALLLLLFLWSLSSFTSNPISTTTATTTTTTTPEPTTRPDPTTFYDDPDLSYTLDTPVYNWDEKRRQWAALNPPSLSSERVVMVTGSQPGPCTNPNGDHLLLKLFKNKLDYCRIHGYDMFYNNVLLNPNMFSFWAKYSAIRAAMVAHPEAEWIWWVDSDAAITDMDFNLPLEKYKAYNLVLHGWADLVFKKKSWTGLNAGVFLIRNCQWSMGLLDRWAGFGPQGPDYKKWGEVQREMFKDKLYHDSDDQTALAYMMVEEREKWADKIYLESEYYLEGYWVEIVGGLEGVAAEYRAAERKVRRLRRRRAEKSGGAWGGAWEEYMKKEGFKRRRPFITHFTGCEPCSGTHNEMYSREDCWDGMIKALNFADDQVLRNYGYFRPDLSNSSWVLPLKSFD